MVTFSGFGRQRAVGEVVVAARAGDATRVGRVHRSRDLVVVDREVRHVGGCAGHLELVAGRGRNLTAVQRPIHEMVAFGRFCRQRAVRTVVVSTRAAH